jgi:hypothetical protein
MGSEGRSHGCQEEGRKEEGCEEEDREEDGVDTGEHFSAPSTESSREAPLARSSLVSAVSASPVVHGNEPGVDVPIDSGWESEAGHLHAQEVS